MGIFFDEFLLDTTGINLRKIRWYTYAIIFIIMIIIYMSLTKTTV